MRKLTTLEFIEKAKIIHQNLDYSLVEYKNAHVKVKIICSIHGVFESSPNGLLCGKGCKLCSIERNAKKLSSNTQDFVEKARKIHPNYNWSLVNYKNALSKIEVICPIHGIFKALPSNILKGCECRKCYYSTIGPRCSSNTKDFVEKAKIIHPNYDFTLVNYKSGKIKIKVVCPIHGIFEIRPNDLLQGNRCSKCTNNRKYTTLEFIEKIKVIHPKYNFSNFVYINNRTKSTVICPIHGDFVASPSNLIKGHGCPNCKRSKGEELIGKWLQENNLKFTPQKKFSTCKDKLELPFDFHIDNTEILIEYDGIQHYKSVEWCGGDDAFEYIKKHDNIKNTWARDNNYTIVRLNYLMSKNEKIEALEAIKLNNLLKKAVANEF